MVVVPLSRPGGEVEASARTGQIKTGQAKSPDLAVMAAGGTLLVASLLLLRGHRRAGLALTATGTALALLNEQDTVRAWWKAFPIYLDGAQWLLDQAQDATEQLSAKRERLRNIFNR